jgi:Xaa-Pro aminopeptidase
MFFLSGYTGEGLLVIARNLSAIVTDFRYVEQAREQAPGFSVHSISNEVTHAQIAASLMKEAGISQALYEDDYVTVRAAKQLAEAMGEIALLTLNNHPETLRQFKDQHEISLLEKACDISSEAYEFICGAIKPGMSEIQIRRLLDNSLMEQGAQTTSFHTIVASGPNGALPHAIAGDRIVQSGDMITLDFGALYKGYCADMTRTVSLGKPSEKMLEVFNIVLETQAACQDALAPGKPCNEVDALARKMIGDAGYGEYFGHGLGHSVGIDIHEDPRLSPKCTDKLAQGHVVTVEPGIYLPGTGGVRIENTCVITAHGARTLVKAPRELRIL